MVSSRSYGKFFTVETSGADAPLAVGSTPDAFGATIGLHRAAPATRC
jgi:hypothetical protein